MGNEKSGGYGELLVSFPAPPPHLSTLTRYFLGPLKDYRSAGLKVQGIHLNLISLNLSGFKFEKWYGLGLRESHLFGGN